MTFLWLFIYVCAGAHDLFNHTAHDTAWLLTLAVCVVIDVLGLIESRGAKDDDAKDGDD